ncbi:MAG: methyltransferase family protein [Rubrimonas sp.]
MSLLRRLDLPPIWLAAFMATTWAWATALPTAPLGGEAASVALWVGRLLVACGLGLIAWAALLFRRHRTPIEPRQRPRVLLTTGPYRLTRNPIYRGLLMILLGWALSQGDMAPLVLVPAYGFILLRRFVTPEEATARMLFSDEYDRWAERVRWRL